MKTGRRLITLLLALIMLGSSFAMPGVIPVAFAEENIPEEAATPPAHGAFAGKIYICAADGEIPVEGDGCIGGAAVKLYTEGNVLAAETVTDADGMFWFESVAAGVYTAVVSGMADEVCANGFVLSALQSSAEITTGDAGEKQLVIRGIEIISDDLFSITIGFAAEVEPTDNDSNNEPTDIDNNNTTTDDEDTPDEEEIDIEEVMSDLTYEGQHISDIDLVPDDRAGAAAEYSAPVQGPARAAKAGARLFAAFLSDDPPAPRVDFSANYVKQSDAHNITKSADFMLKYQLNMSTEDDIEEGQFCVRVPYVLMNYRDDGIMAGADIIPADISVPQANDDGTANPGRTTPLNYRMVTEDGVDYIEFYNYKKILAGTRLAWQVLYADKVLTPEGISKNQSINTMEINDGTPWDLPATAYVNGSPLKTEHLTGLVDTDVNLSTLSKIPFANQRNYTPILYTAGQLSKYASLSKLAQPLDFNNYAYVLWKLSVNGDYGQYWELYLDEHPTWTGPAGGGEGEVVAISRRDNRGGWNAWTPKDLVMGEGEYSDKYLIASYSTEADYLKTEGYKGKLNAEFYVITRYDRRTFNENGEYILKNQADIYLKSLDSDVAKSLSSNESGIGWSEYKWEGDGTGDIELFKTSNGGNYGYPAWKEVYLNAKVGGMDYGSMYFGIHNGQKGYKTAYNWNKSASDYADYDPFGYMPGKYIDILTTDDIEYIYAKTNTEDGTAELNKGIVLDEKDYYFTKVSVTSADYQYDFFESAAGDTPTAEAFADKEGTIPLDRSVYVYAMFADNPDEWELVKTIPWSASGKMSYSFTADELARQPYRVKTQHKTVDYNTCDIGVTVRIRHDSPAFASLYSQGADEIILTNEVATMTKDQNGRELHGPTMEYTISNNKGVDLAALGEAIHGAYEKLPCRSSAIADLKPVEKKAAASKSAGIQNDPVAGQFNLTYTLKAYESYPMSDAAAVGIMQDSDAYENVLSHRNAVEFYDLLPKDVQFDPTVPVQAYRVVGLLPGEVDGTDVTVTVDPAVDVIENWRGSERTMVIFHVNYTGADPSALYYYEDINKYDPYYHWLTGYQIKFGAYTRWEEAEVSLEESNIAAYMPAKGDLKPLVGTNTEVMCDDGNVNGIYVNDSAYDPFRGVGDYAGVTKKGDINDDGITDNRNVLYCSASKIDDFAKAVKIGIIKEVHADDDLVSAFADEGTVKVDKGYTYRLTVSNPNDEVRKLTDIFIFDRIENAKSERQGSRDPLLEEMNASTPWQGEFAGLDLSVARSLGVNAVAYYSINPNAVFPADGEDGMTVITTSSDWVLASEYTGELKDVRAIAVDLTTKTNGDPFELYEGEITDANGNYIEDNPSFISVDVKMTAPEEIPTYTENGEEMNKIYAYNNPAYSGTVLETKKTENGNAVRVKLTDDLPYMVEKKFGENAVPDKQQGTSFSFTLYRTSTLSGNPEPSAYHLYELYTYDEATDKWVNDNSDVFSTDAYGKFTLQAGQRAVFKGADSPDLVAKEEVPSIYWRMTEVNSEQKSIELGNSTANVRALDVTNDYMPLLYVQKKVEGVPATVNMDEESFTFRIYTVDDAGVLMYPAENAEYYLVEKADVSRFNIPVLKSELLYADDEGCITLKADEVAAVRVGGIGTDYVVEEGRWDGDTWVVAGSEAWLTDTEKWVPQQSPAQQRDLLGTYGSNAKFTNYYRFKDVNILKEVTNKNGDCTEEFTFAVYETVGDVDIAVPNLRWQLTDSEGNVAASGITSNDENTKGQFTAACADKILTVSGLDMYKQYKIAEVALPENYALTSITGDGVVRFNRLVPSKDVTVVNDYRMRDLSITKRVISTDSAAMTESFEMTVRNADGSPVEAPYELISKDGSSTPGATGTDGKFTVKSGETVLFREIGTIGQSFTVTETEHDVYKQLLPAQKLPLTLTLPNEGIAEGTFINGDAGLLVVNKLWQAEDDIAQQWLTQNNAKTGEKADLGIYFKVEVDPAGADNFRAVQSADSIKYFVIRGSGESSEAAPVTEEDIFLEDPVNDAIVLQGINEAWTYRISETRMSFAEDETPLTGAIVDELTKADGSKASVSIRMDCSAESVEGITGNVTDNPAVQLTNTLSGSENTWIYKYMYGGQEPTDGDELVWRVERYKGGRWVPAEGVDYIISYDGKFAADGKVNTTGADGKLVIRADSVSAAGNYAAAVGFLQSVKVNATSGVEGDLRVVEVLEGTAESWGRLVAYSNAKGEYDLFNVPENPAGFVNSGTMRYIRIEKQMLDGSTGDEFTFVLSQNVNGEESVSAGAPYSVWNAEDDSPVAAGLQTGADGSFVLEAGQYAIIPVADNGVWNVSEKTGYPYELVKVETENGDADLEEGATFDLRAALKSGKALNSLMKKGAGYTAEDDGIKSVTFGLKSEYAGQLNGIEFEAPADTADSGSIMLYRLSNGEVYILAETDTILANVDCSDMFNNCTGLTSVDLSKLSTVNTTDMSEMFQNTPALTSVDVSTMNTAKVTDMHAMFAGSGVTELDLTNFDTSGVTDMSQMFKDCVALASLTNGAGFNTVNVTDMSEMFSGCASISTDVMNDFIEGFSTGAVTDMKGLFNGCSTLTTVDISGFNTANVTDMSYMFNGCTNMTTLETDALKTQNVTTMANMFSDTGLTQLTLLTDFNVENVRDFTSMFENSSALGIIICYDDWRVYSAPNSANMFKGCDSIVGGSGTVYDAKHVDLNYAHPDAGTDDPGYFFVPEFKFFYTPASEDTPHIGVVQKFVVPATGKYKIEVWGASGAVEGQQGVTSSYSSDHNNTGGYATGIIELERGQELFIAVGEKGRGMGWLEFTKTGGWNGGGNSGKYYPNNNNNIPGTGDTSEGGGGATSIQLSLIGDGQLKNYVDKKEDVLIVAGGGGGQQNNSSGGYGGGVTGNSQGAAGGNQNGGSGYIFGQGIDGHVFADLSAGGGGGWYGGKGSTTSSQAGGGGSSYIKGIAGFAVIPDSRGIAFISGETINGNIIVNNKYVGPSYPASEAPVGNELNPYVVDGFARITFIPGA